MLENWSVYLGLIVGMVILMTGVISFSKMPKDEQIAKVKELLLAWVMQAEKDLGAGTGPIKLRTVYDKFAKQVPALFKVITFDTFSVWVDEALEQMEDLLRDERIEAYVKNEL